MNYIKTTILLIVLTVLLMWIGRVIGGPRGVIIAFLVSMIINGVSYWFSDKIVLAIYKAKELPKEGYSRLYDMVAELSKNAKIPSPRIYLMDMDQPNAFATGRGPEHAALCLTKGLLNLLDEEEIKGVISHELSHIKNRDTLIMTVTAALASAIMMIANMARWTAFLGGGSSKDDRKGSGNIVALLALSILAPIAALLVQMAISRSREYAADKRGAYLTGNPNGLARALEDLSAFSKKYKTDVVPQTAHLFIVNPLTGSFIANLFSTHPPIEERVKRLKELIA